MLSRREVVIIFVARLVVDLRGSQTALSRQGIVWMLIYRRAGWCCRLDQGGSGRSEVIRRLRCRHISCDLSRKLVSKIAGYDTTDGGAVTQVVDAVYLDVVLGAIGGELHIIQQRP